MFDKNAARICTVLYTRPYIPLEENKVCMCKLQTLVTEMLPVKCEVNWVRHKHMAKIHDDIMQHLLIPYQVSGVRSWSEVKSSSLDKNLCLSGHKG